MMKKLIFYFFLLSLITPLQAQEWVIATVAGNGLSDVSLGDGGQATAASLNQPHDIALDAQGNLYIVDTWHQRIRKVTPNGIISTVAGNGTAGYSGDGGLATEAQLNYPQSVAVDEQGHLYIADLRNYRIRKVGTDGIISTYSGTGERGYSGDNGLAVQAKHDSPYDLAMDAQGNLYVVEKTVSAVRKIDTQGVISTIIGYASFSETTIGDGLTAIKAQLWEPEGIAADAYGRLFIADTLNNRIRMIDETGVIYTVAGSGYRGTFAAQYLFENRLAIESEISMPKAIALDSTGRLYINDWARDLIREVNIEGRLNSIAGTPNKTGFAGDLGAALQAKFSSPAGLAVDGQGNVYVADKHNHRVRKLMRNKPPVAAFEYEVENDVAPWAVTLDGSESYDPKGLPLQFEWFDALGQRLTTAEQWTWETPDAGEYEFTLSVQDAFGSRDTLTQTVSVATEPSEPTEPPIACDERAVFDPYTGRLHIPAISIVTEYLDDWDAPMLSVDFIWHPKGVFNVLQANIYDASTSDESCHAQYQADLGTLFLPYVDVKMPMANGEFETVSYSVILQLNFLRPHFVLYAVELLN